MIERDVRAKREIEKKCIGIRGKNYRAVVYRHKYST